jgi:hypothetical protein
MSIEREIITILKNNGINPILSGNPEFLATIRIYEEDKVDKIINELEPLFEKFNSYFVTSSHVSSCCAPSFDEIRYKVIL